MKLSPLLLIILMAASCQQKVVDQDEIEISQYKFYLKSTGKPFSGIVNYRSPHFYDSNKVQTKYTYVNGVPRGKWFAYGFAGEVTHHGEFIDLSQLNSPVPYRVKCERVDVNRWFEGDVEFIDVNFIKPVSTFSDVDIEELVGVVEKAFPNAGKNISLNTMLRDTTVEVYPHH